MNVLGKKLSELTQKDSIKDYWFLILNDALQNEIAFGQTVFKMLMIANGSAIFLMCAFIGSSIDTSVSSPLFVIPLACFIVGLNAARRLIEHASRISSLIAKSLKDQTLGIVLDQIDVDKALHFGFDETAIKFVHRYKRQSTVALFGGIITTVILLVASRDGALDPLFKLLV